VHFTSINEKFIKWIINTYIQLKMGSPVAGGVTIIWITEFTMTKSGDVPSPMIFSSLKKFVWKVSSQVFHG
jgi:hypothetical protein